MRQRFMITIQTNTEYESEMGHIEAYLQKATYNGGFQSLSSRELNIML